MATFAYATTATAIAAFLILLPLSCSSESILDHHDDDSSSSVTQSDVDLLEFPLNLEYLEAEFFLYGAFGRGLDTVDPSLTLGGPAPVSAKRAHLDHFTRDVITQFAWQEVGHLRSLIFNSFVEGRVHEPLDLWKRKICEGFRPNIVAYTTRIHDLCTNGKMGDAVSVCYEMERNGSPRPHIALLLMALQKQVPLLAALHLYNMMNRGCRPNEFLDGLFKANRFEEAYGIVSEIEEIRMGLNLETYNTTLNDFSSGW